MANNGEWFDINNLEDFIDSSRKLVFKFFGNSSSLDSEEELFAAISNMSKEEQEELEETLTIQECELIAKNHLKTRTNKKTKKVKYLLNDKILNNIIEDMNTRMVSNILNKLVNKGILESGYDEEINDFVFWTKNDENNTNNKEKPETD